MPTAEYENKAGKRLERFFQKRAPDSVTVAGEKYRKCSVPSRIFVPSGAPNPNEMRESVRRGYKKLEEKGKWRQGGKHYTKNQVKKIWGF